jgi:hypothetical protein
VKGTTQTTNLNHETRCAIATRAARGINGSIALVFASAALLFLMVVAGVMGSSRSAPAPITTADARSGPFVTAYGNMIQQVEYGLTPESVAATSDGG